MGKATGKSALPLARGRSASSEGRITAGCLGKAKGHRNSSHTAPSGLQLTDDSRQHVPLSPGLEDSSLAELRGTPRQARPLGVKQSRAAEAGEAKAARSQGTPPATLKDSRSEPTAEIAL